MTSPIAFGPGTTTSISASVTSASGTLTGSGNQVRINNATGQRAFFRFGVSSATAVSTDCPIEAGATEVFTRPTNMTVLAVILAAGSGTFYVTVGDGQ